MTVPDIDASQHRAARVVGTLYLLLMAMGVFSQIYVPATTTVAGDPTATARAILDSEGLFRLGVGVDFLCFTGDAALAVAYFVMLRPVSRGLAMLGAFWRLAQAAVLAAYTGLGIAVLALLTNADGVTGLPESEAVSLAWIVLDVRKAGFSLGFVLLGLGSVVFSYLLFRSRYVPRALSGLGIVASSILAGGSLLTVVAPATTSVVNPALFVPMFFFEVGTGLWLLIRGIRRPAAQSRNLTSA